VLIRGTSYSLVQTLLPYVYNLATIHSITVFTDRWTDIWMTVKADQCAAV